MRKFSLDILLFATMLYLMCYRFVPRFPHELLGTLILIMLGIHIYWDRKAFRWNFLNSILILTFAISIVSGILLSHELFRDLIDGAFRKNILVHKLHSSIPYFAMIFSGFHLGKNLWFKLPIPICGILIVSGIWGSIQNSLLNHLIFERVHHAERHPDFSIELFLSILTMYLMFVAIGYLWKIRRRLKS